MSYTIPGGIIYAILYLISRNVYLVGVVHGIGNATTSELMPTVQNGIPTEPAIYVLVLAVGLISAIPLWISRRRRAANEPTAAPVAPA